jgi:hypothetical protein
MLTTRAFSLSYVDWLLQRWNLGDAPRNGLTNSREAFFNTFQRFLIWVSALTLAVNRLRG